MKTRVLKGEAESNEILCFWDDKKERVKDLCKEKYQIRVWRSTVL